MLLTQPSRLLSSPINLAALREDAWRELTSLFDSLEGRITLVLDPQLEPALKLIAVDGSKALKEHRVDTVQTLDGNEAPSAADGGTVLFLTRPLPHLIRLVAAQVRALSTRITRVSCHCVLTPKRTFLCDSILKDEGVLSQSAAQSTVGASLEPPGAIAAAAIGALTLGEYGGFDILPVDDDLLVLNNDTTIADVSGKGDTAPLYAVAQALLKMQNVYGPFSTIRGKGPMAGTVIELLLRLTKEAEAGGDNTQAVNTNKDTSTTTGTGSSSGDSENASHISGFSLASAVANTQVYVRNTSAAGTVASVNADTNTPNTLPPRGEVDVCIVLDRMVDYVTPLLTSLTYESLLDESDLGPIRDSLISVDASMVVDTADDLASPGTTKATTNSTPVEPTTGSVTLYLNSNAKLYTELRDLNIQKAGPRLATRAREMQTLRDSITKSRAADLAVADIRRFVKQIPGLQADMKLLRILINLTEPIKTASDTQAFVDRWQRERAIIDEDAVTATYDAISTAIAKNSPLLPTLRLLCLQAVVEGGVKSKTLDSFRKQLLQTYGFKSMLPTLRSLENSYLLRVREGSEGLAAAFSTSVSNWSMLRKGFGLTADGEVDVEDPQDIHYVTSGYAPLSIRLIQSALSLASLPTLSAISRGETAPIPDKNTSSSSNKNGPGPSPSWAGTNGWQSSGVADLLKLLPGPTWHVTQGVASSNSTTNTTSNDDNGTGSSDTRKVVMVVFVGGVTYTEMACLRFIAERASVDFVVLASTVTSGPRLLSQFLSKTISTE